MTTTTTTEVPIVIPRLDMREPRIIAGAADPTLVPIEAIRIDGGTQARAGLDEATVQEYAATWQDLSYERNGLSKMPPIVVYYDGESYWLADGFHRVEAYKRYLEADPLSAAPRALLAEIKQGTRRDAVLYACGANDAHGLRRTRADVQRAIEMLLKDGEWGLWSDREIARQVHCSPQTVAATRKELESGAQIEHLTERRGADGKIYPADGKKPATPQADTDDDNLADAHDMSWTAAEYKIIEARDTARLNAARAAIAEGNYGPARQCLQAIEVLTWQRDQVLATIPQSGWTCATCGQIQTDMKEPTPPICTSCVMAGLIVGQRSDPHKPDPKEPPPPAPAADPRVEAEIKRLCAISGSRYLGIATDRPIADGPSLPQYSTRYRLALFGGGGGDYLADEAIAMLTAICDRKRRETLAEAEIAPVEPPALAAYPAPQSLHHRTWPIQCAIDTAIRHGKRDDYQSAWLELGDALYGPGGIVLPPFPEREREALIESIKYVVEEFGSVHTTGRRAAPALNFLRAIGRKLAETEPGAPIQTAPDDPLAMIRSGIAAAEQLIADGDLSGVPNLLTAAERELTRFADDPAVSDAAYQELARAIGAAREALQQAQDRPLEEVTHG